LGWSSKKLLQQAQAGLEDLGHIVKKKKTFRGEVSTLGLELSILTQSLMVLSSPSHLPWISIDLPYFFSSANRDQNILKKQKEGWIHGKNNLCRSKSHRRVDANESHLVSNLDGWTSAAKGRRRGF